MSKELFLKIADIADSVRLSGQTVDALTVFAYRLRQEAEREENVIDGKGSHISIPYTEVDTGKMIMLDGVLYSLQKTKDITKPERKKPEARAGYWALIFRWGKWELLNCAWWDSLEENRAWQSGTAFRLDERHLAEAELARRISLEGKGL